jgi:transcription antitermination factor NusG
MSITREPNEITWMPVRTKPRCEKKVAEYCEAHQIEYYLPLLRRLHRYEKRTAEFFVPMFPSYIFCALNDKLYSQLVRSNAVLFRIPLDGFDEEHLIEELDALRAFEKMAKEADIVVNPKIIPGVLVEVVSGPMKGTKGVVERRKGKVSITINIELLGQSATMDIDAGDLEVSEGGV